MKQNELRTIYKVIASTVRGKSCLTLCADREIDLKGPPLSG